jgi:hypothetical protein
LHHFDQHGEGFLFRHLHEEKADYEGRALAI